MNVDDDVRTIDARNCLGRWMPTDRDQKATALAAGKLRSREFTRRQRESNRLQEKLRSQEQWEVVNGGGHHCPPAVTKMLKL